MSTEVFKLYGTIGVKTDEVNKGLTDVSKKAKETANNLSTQFTNIGNSLSKVGDKISNVGKTLSATLTLGIGALVTQGIHYNAQMETFQMNLTTLLGSADKASKLLGDLKEMAATTPFETTDLIAATETMVGFGISANDAQKYLGVLGDISMGNSEKLSGLALAFSQVQSTGKLTGQDLLQMINQGFNPLLYISKMTGESMAEVKERMSKTGISAKEVADAFEYATQKGQPFYKAMENGAQTISGRISTLKDNFNMLVGDITASLLPTFEKIVDKAIELTEKFSNLSQEQKDNILKWAGIVAAIGPVLMIIGKLTSGVGTLLVTFGKIRTAISATRSGVGFLGTAFKVLTGPVGIVIAIVGALIAVFAYLYNTNEGFRTQMQELGQQIMNSLKPALDTIMTTIQTLSSSIMPVITQLLESLMPILSQIIIIIAEAATQLIVSIMPLIGQILQNLTPLITMLVSSLMPVISQIILSIGQIIQAALPFISMLVSSLIPIISQIILCIGQILQNLTPFITMLVSTLIPIISQIILFIGQIIEAAMPLINLIIATIMPIISQLVSFISEAINLILSIVMPIIEQIVSFIQENMGTIKAVIETVFGGIKKIIESVMKVIQGIINVVMGIIKGDWSQVWEGIKQIFVGVWEAIKTYVTTVINVIKTIITTVFNAIKNVVSKVWDSIKTSISKAWESIKTGVSNAINSVKNTVSNVFNTIKTKVTTIWNNIKSAIEKPINKAKEIVKTAIDKIKGFFNFQFKWPQLKMPHFGISPSGWKIGDLLKGSIPKLKIDWYAKAMDDGMILDKPTIFGINPKGALMGAGEAGSETVVGTNSLMEMIQNATANSNEYVAERLDAILAYLQAMLPDINNKQLVLSTGELVGALANPIDTELGKINNRKGRGR